MNEPSSTPSAAAIERAALAIEAVKLQVIDRDWQSGEHRLDLVATPGDGILAAVEVRAVAHGTRDERITAISEDRIRQLTGAAHEWIREHDARYDDLWLVIVMVDPDGSVELVVAMPRRWREWTPA
jgi:Holliday junction resolvase-like predicted endonuclease